MHAPIRYLSKIFVTGALAALPLVATVLIIVWGVRLVAAWIGPGSLVGGLLLSLGLGISTSETVNYLVGLAIVLLLIFLLGTLVHTRLRTVLAAMTDGVVQRIPVVRNVYDAVRRFVELISQRDSEGLRSMRPVWLHFGGVGGAAVLGLLSNADPVPIEGQEYLAVLVPTAPVPVGGGLLYVPISWVTDADLGVEGLTSIYVSMGMTSHQHLGAGRAGRR